MKVNLIYYKVYKRPKVSVRYVEMLDTWSERLQLYGWSRGARYSRLKTPTYIYIYVGIIPGKIEKNQRNCERKKKKKKGSEKLLAKRNAHWICTKCAFWERVYSTADGRWNRSTDSQTRGKPTRLCRFKCSYIYICTSIPSNSQLQFIFYTLQMQGFFRYHSCTFTWQNRDRKILND